MSLQIAKDTFYAVLRDRIAAGNVERTAVVRGLLRPGVVVEENELPVAAADGITLADAFYLVWTGVRVDGHGGQPLVGLGCEIRYVTDGTQGFAGMDRGRALGAMDAELAAALELKPQSATGEMVAEIAGGGASTVVAAGTRIFWGDVTFKPTVIHGERMERTAEVEVFCYGY